MSPPTKMMASGGYPDPGSLHFLFDDWLIWYSLKRVTCIVNDWPSAHCEETRWFGPDFDDFFERYLGLILYTPSTRVQASFLWLPVILDLRPPREGNMVLGLKTSDKTEKSILGRTKPLSTTTPANSHDIVSQNQHYPMAPRCFNKQFNIYKHWETHVLPSSDILGPGTSAKKWSSSRRAARRRLRATRAKQRIKHVQTYMGLRAFQLVWQDAYIYIWQLLPAQTREVCSEIGSIWLCYMLCSAMSFG